MSRLQGELAVEGKAMTNFVNFPPPIFILPPISLPPVILYPTPGTQSSSDNDTPKIAGVVSIVVLVLLISCLCIKKITELRGLHKSKIKLASPTINMVQVLKIDEAAMEKFLQEMAGEKPVRYSAEQICAFTNNYSTRLGSGGFGIVYKGEFPNGMEIAVKVLNRSLDKRVEEQFMAEVRTIGRTYHINLVRLYGFSFDHSMSALIYEYMENGSLDKYLFSKEMSLDWEKLCDIAIGTAKGLVYLHEECHQRIIHYDIKPGNVLLDANFSPKVADFGLAKLCNRENTHVSVSEYRGTPGYSAPEFLLKNYPITHKCDVYSFGMLLFEILGRRRNANVNTSGNLDWFPRRVWEEYEKGGLDEMTIECDIEEKDREKAKRMFKVALWCVQDSPEARPHMSSVVKMLEGEVEIGPPPEPFQYMYAVVTHVHVSQIGTFTGSSYSTTGIDSSPIMKKYEIQRVGPLSN